MGEEHHLAYIKYYEKGAKDHPTNSDRLHWAKKRMHGGGEGYWYDVIHVQSILGPVFIVPKFGDWTSGESTDTFYICPWQRYYSMLPATTGLGVQSCQSIYPTKKPLP